MKTLAATLLVLQTFAVGQAPPATDSYAVHCGTLHIGNGDVKRNAWLVVVDGRVDRVSTEAPAGLRIIDAADKVVMPGLVVADSDLSRHGEAAYTVTPDFVALDGFDFMRERPQPLSGGVTTVYLSPGRERLVTGQGSVVKTAGSDPTRRIVAERNCLRVTLGEESTKAPTLFEPTVAPTADDPLLPARTQVPTARISQLAELRSVFRAAVNADGKRSAAGLGAVEDRYRPQPIADAAKGRLPLRIAARAAADLRRALEFARETGARSIVLEDPWDCAKVATQIAASGAAVVVRVPVRPGAANPDAEADAEAPQSRPENAALAAAAGITVALAPIRDEDLSDMLLIAGVAARYGLAPERALRALTLDAARVLGVDARVGSLEPGKDADFLVLSGEPLAIGTMVEETWIDGTRAWQRDAPAQLLAVRVGKILTGTGETIRDGLIVVENGKIKTIGTDLAIPYGAKVLDCSDSVMTPGFIDAYSHLGLTDGGAEVPRGAADQVVAEVVDPDDEAFAAARAAGLTTVLVSGSDNDPVSGRVAALKTAGVDRASMVLKPTAAIRMVYDDVSTDGVEALAQRVERGKSYIEKWQRYEKALADWKAGKGEKPVLEEAPSTGGEDPVSGVWELEIYDLPFPIEIKLVLTLTLQGTTVTGEAMTTIRGTERGPTPIENGKFENGTLILEVAAMRNSSTLEARIDNDALQGTFGSGQFSGKVRGQRVSKDASAAVAAGSGNKDGTPTRPRVDESLEPLRALWEKRIPAVVRADRAPAIAAVIDYFAKQELPLLLTGVRDAVEVPDLFGERRPGLILGPQIVRRERGELVNAAVVLGERGHPMAIGTGDAAGSCYLGVHAAMAVRYGLPPTDALAALTIQPARMFKIDDRVGSLERGKDADFVVFSGNPFELTSRVQLVVIDGRVVVDRRSGGER